MAHRQLAFWETPSRYRAVMVGPVYDSPPGCSTPQGGALPGVRALAITLIGIAAVLIMLSLGTRFLAYRREVEPAG